MCLSFTPKFGEMIQFDEHIFQLGWFNHQLVRVPKQEGNMLVRRRVSKVKHLKICMELKNHPIEKEKHFPNLHC